MILGQLFNLGRRFCEQQPATYIPRSNYEFALVAYTIRDQFRSLHFDRAGPDLYQSLSEWLKKQDCVAYIKIERRKSGRQIEFPPPVGEISRDRLFLTAATRSDLEIACYEWSDPASERSSLRQADCSCWRMKRREVNFLNLDQDLDLHLENTLSFKFAS